jgi:hypothetical protein
MSKTTKRANQYVTGRKVGSSPVNYFFIQEDVKVKNDNGEEETVLVHRCLHFPKDNNADT